MTVSPMCGERITVTLIPKAEDDLRQLQERTRLSKTDLANRAITLYEFFDAQLRAGRDMVAIDQETGETAAVLVRLPDNPAGQAQRADPVLYGRGRPRRPQRSSRRQALSRSRGWPRKFLLRLLLRPAWQSTRRASPFTVAFRKKGSVRR